MKLRFAWGATTLLVWMGCGGAFTSVDPGADGGAGTETTTTTTGAAGNVTAGVGGNTGEGGTIGAGGSSSGTAGSSTGSGGSSTGAGGGSAGSGGSVGTGGSGGGHGSDWGACDGPGQCVALATSCCGSCGGDVSTFSGVNVKRVQDFHQQLCPNPVACPNIACIPTTSPSNIGARCVAGRCEAFDVTKVPEYSACAVTADCHLRDGLGCCVCNSNAEWVAVNATGEKGIADAECAPNTACADCFPVPPARTLATCSSDHVCRVLLAP